MKHMSTAQVDLLSTELQRCSVLFAEILPLHPQHPLVPGGGDLHVLAVDNDVVDAIDGEPHQPRPS
jgi:hypothetical protein